MNKRKYYNENLRRRVQYENIYTTAFYVALREQKQTVLREVRKSSSLSALIYIDKLDPEPIMKVYRRLYKKVVVKEGELEYRRLMAIPEQKAGFGFVIDWLADISEFLDRYLLEKVVRPMTALTMERMRQTLTRGIAQGESYDDIERSLADTELDKTRARLIARTETNRAMNYGSNIGAKATPYEIDKEWLSASDMRVRGRADIEKARADHWALNGQTVAEDAPFIDPRSGAYMNYPGDSTGANGTGLIAGAADVCNCRCTHLNIPRRDANDRLVMRQTSMLPV